MLRLVSVGSELPGVFAVGREAKGVFAFGLVATGVVAFGGLATGVIAVGQGARGVIAVGQGAIGLVAVGQVSVGVLWSTGQLTIGGSTGPGQETYGLFPVPRLRRVLAWLRREPWDTVPGRPRWPAWRQALSAIALAGLAVAWWFAVGQALVTALF